MLPRLHLPLRRSHRNRLLRASLLAALLFTLIDILSLRSTRSSIPPSPTIYTAPASTLPPTSALPRTPYTGPPIFLASTHWNNAALLSSNWTSAILSLASYLGPSKIYISIVESGSWDNSGEILRGLDAELGKLGVGRTVTTGGRTHKEEMERPVGEGWVKTGRNGGGWELRRVPYLAGVRNEVLRVLWEGVEGVRDAGGKGEKVRVKRGDDGGGGEVKGPRKGGVGIRRKPKGKKPEPDTDAAGQEEQTEEKEGGWDWGNVGKVVWINDVVFTVDDVLNLINTRDGDYAAACSMDYSKPPAYYDTFALRDIEGYEAVTSTFPYFRSKISRQAMIAGQPVPVQSCWNGMVSFSAPPFTTPSSSRPLSFRGTPDSLAATHLEASECCLIHTDNPLTPSKGVFLNPGVRVGYSDAAYRAVHPTSNKNKDKDNEAWPSLAEASRGVWWNRVRRWTTTEWFKRRMVRRRVEGWQRGEKGEGEGKGEVRWESGERCLVNEMQVIVENGWAHV